MNIPKPDSDGWFNANECKPPVGRFVEVKTGNQITEAYFNGMNWAWKNETVAQPEFWRLRK